MSAMRWICIATLIFSGCVSKGGDPSPAAAREETQAKTPPTDWFVVDIRHRTGQKCDAFDKGSCADVGHWAIHGASFDIKDSGIEGLAVILKVEADRDRGAGGDPSISERAVLLCGDPSTPWTLIQRAMTEGAKAGIYKFSWRASRSREEGNIVEVRLPIKARDAIEQIRISMHRDAEQGAIIRKVGLSQVVNDRDLTDVVMSRKADLDALKKSFPVIIDAAPEVPWNEVVHVVELCRQSGIARIEFAAEFGISEEPEIFFPEDKHEEKDEGDKIDPMGEGPDKIPGKAYSCRFGARANLVARGGGSKATENAVKNALLWLCRHQNRDGSWSGKDFTAQCQGDKHCTGLGKEDFDTGLTALSLLAFLGAGYTHVSKEHLPDNFNADKDWNIGQVVKNALQWLISAQNADGSFGPQSIQPMYNNAMAAMALSEAYGMTHAAVLKEPAQKAIDYIVSAQNPGKGWRYTKKCGENDTSVTGWCVMALRSADMSGLQFPKSALDGALAWIKEATDDSGYFIVGYNRAGTGKVVIIGKNERFEHHQSMFAAAAMSRTFIQMDRKEPALQSLPMLIDDLPEWKANMIDFYYWYWSSLALCQLDGPDGPLWKKWNEAMKNALVPNQKTKKDGCQCGSWSPEEERWGFEGGRVYSTAINALTLEVYYRYPLILSAKK